MTSAITQGRVRWVECGCKWLRVLDAWRAKAFKKSTWDESLLAGGMMYEAAYQAASGSSRALAVTADVGGEQSKLDGQIDCTRWEVENSQCQYTRPHSSCSWMQRRSVHAQTIDRKELDDL
jgi:hypothetical protein